jgi:hypothetical protein
VLAPPAAASGQVGVALSLEPAPGGFGDNLQLVGDIPAGCEWDDTAGRLTGTPTAPGSFPVRLRGWNEHGPGAWVDWTVTIAAAEGTASITTADMLEIPVGVDIDLHILTDLGYDFIDVHNLPAGLVFDPATGRITGRLRSALDASVELSAVNGEGWGAPQLLTLVGSSQPYAAWRYASFGQEILDLGTSGDEADPDRDGLANLGEYALGMDALSAGSRGGLVTAIDGGELRVTYTRPKAATDIIYNLRTTPVLGGPWTDHGPGDLVSETGTHQTMEVYISLEPGSAFIKLEMLRN